MNTMPLTTEKARKRHEMIWFFEGLDKSGKTTLARLCRFQCVPAHPCLMFDRGYVGREVFWHFNHEVDFPIEAWLRTESLLAREGVYGIIWCRTLPETSLKREQEAGEVSGVQEVVDRRLKELREQDCLFQRLIPIRQRMGVPVIETWTDRALIDGTVEHILTSMSGGNWTRRK